MVVFGIFILHSPTMYNIGIDMMGGDFAPKEAVIGVQQFYQQTSAATIQLTLFGNEDEILSLLKAYKVDSSNVTIVPTTEVIEMNEHPTKALKQKQNSSISVGFKHLVQNKIDAFISAGNTGAMLVGTMFSIKTIEGVMRPTISSIIPKQNGSTGLIVDVGINADCKPEFLNQFALMGSIYAKEMLNINNPKVGLMNVGEEEGKGNSLLQNTYPLLKNNSQINFIGNIEGRDVFNDKADVIVCDGVTGNIILKLAESIFDIKEKEKINNDYLSRFNFELYGGTPVLGVEKPVIIGHGISKSFAFVNMIHTAHLMLKKNVLAKLKAALSE